MAKLYKQLEFCVKNNLPMLAPTDGVCFSCGRSISDKGDAHITSCEYCNSSYVE